MASITLYTLTIRTNRPQSSVNQDQTAPQGLIMIYTVCCSITLFYTPVQILKWTCSKFCILLEEYWSPDILGKYGLCVYLILYLLFIWPFKGK